MSEDARAKAILNGKAETKLKHPPPKNVTNAELNKLLREEIIARRSAHSQLKSQVIAAASTIAELKGTLKVHRHELNAAENDRNDLRRKVTLLLSLRCSSWLP